MAPGLSGSCECGSEFVHAGPLWLGRLVDRGFVHEVAGDLVKRNFKFGQQELVFLARCAEEADGPPTFYDMHELARRAGASPPKIVGLIAKLRGRGYFASRTHFSGTGFRSNAPMNEIVEIFKNA